MFPLWIDLSSGHSIQMFSCKEKICDSVAVFNFQIVYRELRKILIEQQKHT
jgi:hypothetical protein